MADSLIKYSEEHKAQCKLAESCMIELWNAQFNMKDLRDLVDKYDAADKEKSDKIDKLEREVKLFSRIMWETAKKNSELEDLIKYIFHADYVHNADNRGMELQKRIKANFSPEQKKLLIDYLDYYKYDYIDKSMNSVKDLHALEYRNWSLWAIASLKLVIQKMIDPKQKFDAIIWEFVNQKVKQAEEDAKK